MTGNELRKLRKSTGLTREQFAVLVLGVSAQTVGRWETERGKIPELHGEGIKVRVADYLANRKK